VLPCDDAGISLTKNFQSILNERLSYEADDQSYLLKEQFTTNLALTHIVNVFLFEQFLRFLSLRVLPPHTRVWEREQQFLYFQTF